MKLGLPILPTDRHRPRGPGGPVSTGVRTPRAQVRRRAGASRQALEASCRSQGSRDLTTIGAPAAKTLAGAQEGATRA